MLEEDAASGGSERLRVDVAYIGNAANKMHQLLDELLELSRLGHLVNPPQDVPLEGVARDAMSLVSGRILKRGAEVVIAPRSCPPSMATGSD
jgi:light-regulated signal transduction histidine kinase (bacteriophytochrome)